MLGMQKSGLGSTTRQNPVSSFAACPTPAGVTYAHQSAPVAKAGIGQHLMLEDVSKSRFKLNQLSVRKMCNIWVISTHGKFHESEQNPHFNSDELRNVSRAECSTLRDRRKLPLNGFGCYEAGRGVGRLGIPGQAERSPAGNVHCRARTDYRIHKYFLIAWTESVPNAFAAEGRRIW